MPRGYADSPAGGRRAVIDNPHIVDSYYGTRVKTFTTALFDGVLKAKRRWFMHEYQGRGSIHTHGCVKLEKDPGLVDKTAIAYAGVIAKRRLDEDGNDFDDDERQNLNRLVADGVVVERVVCQYAD